MYTRASAPRYTTNVFHVATYLSRGQRDKTRLTVVVPTSTLRHPPPSRGDRVHACNACRVAAYLWRGQRDKRLTVTSTVGLARYVRKTPQTPPHIAALLNHRKHTTHSRPLGCSVLEARGTLSLCLCVSLCLCLSPSLSRFNSCVVLLAIVGCGCVRVVVVSNSFTIFFYLKHPIFFFFYL